MLDRTIKRLVVNTLVSVCNRHRFDWQHCDTREKPQMRAFEYRKVPYSITTKTHRKSWAISHPPSS